MKRFKLLAIIGTALVILAVTAGCASLTLVNVDSVEGPARVRQGKDINPSEITVMGIYKDDSRKRVTVRSGDITFDKNTTGSQTVRVRVSGYEGSFQTEVMPLRSLTVSRPPTTTAYKLGQMTDVVRPTGHNAAPVDNPNQAWTGLELQGTWEQLGNAAVDPKDCTITGFNRNQAGRQTITVSYLGRTATFNVEVITLTSIRVTTVPAKTTYITGESFSFGGIVVTGTYSNNSTETISGIGSGNFSGFDSSTAGTKTVTVNVDGKTTTFNVTVVAVNSIAITRPPTKTAYNSGESLNLAGLVVTATYSNGTSGQVTIANSNVSGFSTATAGTKTLTVTYGGKTATFNITVAASINGTWANTNNSNTLAFTFNNGSWECSMNNKTTNKGTYTTAGGKITLIVTHWHGGGLGGFNPPLEQRWYTLDELDKHPGKPALLTFGNTGASDVRTYSINGNTLTMTVEGGNPVAYTKR